MEHKETEKKEGSEGLKINDDYDYNFAVKLNPALRWILVLPMGVVGLLMVQLAGGWVVGFLLRNVATDSIVSIVVNALFGICKYCIFLVSMTATAPVARKNKFRTGLVLALIPFAIPLVFQQLVQTNLKDVDIDPVMMAVNVGVVAVGIVFALASIRSETHKPLSESQEEIPVEDPR